MKIIQALRAFRRARARNNGKYMKMIRLRMMEFEIRGGDRKLKIEIDDQHLKIESEI